MDLAQRKLIDLQSYVEFLQQHNHLIRVKSAVDPDFELAGIARKYQGGKAVLFENVKGRDYPVLIGLYWNRDFMAKFFSNQQRPAPLCAGRRYPRLAPEPHRTCRDKTRPGQ